LITKNTIPILDKIKIIEINNIIKNACEVDEETKVNHIINVQNIRSKIKNKNRLNYE